MHVFLFFSTRYPRWFLRTHRHGVITASNMLLQQVCSFIHSQLFRTLFTRFISVHWLGVQFTQHMSYLTYNFTFPNSLAHELGSFGNLIPESTFCGFCHKRMINSKLSRYFWKKYQKLEILPSGVMSKIALLSNNFKDYSSESAFFILRMVYLVVYCHEALHSSRIRLSTYLGGSKGFLMV